MKKYSILIIGGTGFIGSNLVRFLLTTNHRVVVFSRGHPNIFERFQNVEYIVGNISNYGEVHDVLQGIDYVYHFASSTNPKSSENDLFFDISSNLMASINIMKACVNNDIKKLIYCSSGGTVYGLHTEMPLRENMSCQPISSYGLVKYSIENYLRYFNIKYNLNYEILRLSNPYGIGQDYNSNQGIIAIFINKILNDDTIEVYGNGEIIRDYLYINDFVLLCMKLLTIEKKNNILNVGSGKGYSILDIIEIIEKKLNKKAKITFLPQRDFDVPKIYLDINKVRDLYQWKPQVDIENGIQVTIDWIKGGLNESSI